MPLTDIQIRQLGPRENDYKKADGGGLYVQVQRTGSKLWRLRYRFDGKENVLSFGPYPAVSLARARELRAEAKALLADGIDPSAHAKEKKANKAALTEHTFAKISAELVAKQRKEGKAEITLKKKRWLLEMASDDFGDQPITTISAADILATLRKVESKGNYETAKRLRSSIGQVFRYAIATARAENDPTYGLRGALIAPKVSVSSFGRFGVMKAVPHPRAPH